MIENKKLIFVVFVFCVVVRGSRHMTWCQILRHKRYKRVQEAVYVSQQTQLKEMVKQSLLGLVSCSEFSL